MHPLSLAFLTVAELGPVEAVRVAAETGYQKIGFRILPAGGEAAYPLLTDDALLRDVVGALADTGVATADVEIVRLGDACDWDLFDRFCDRCAALGAAHVLVAGDDPEPGRLAASFARFAALCDGRGLTADLEFMPWTAVPDLAAARAVLDAAGSATAGILIDALHFDRAGVTLAEVAALPAERVHYVQFCDGAKPFDPSTEALVRVARSARLFPGLGGIDLVGLARAIPGDATISVEMPNHDWARRIDARGRAAMAREATFAVLRAASEDTA
jgi:sugar phosphate isomerase/epimerase